MEITVWSLSRIYLCKCSFFSVTVAMPSGYSSTSPLGCSGGQFSWVLGDIECAHIRAWSCKFWAQLLDLSNYLRGWQWKNLLTHLQSFTCEVFFFFSCLIICLSDLLYSCSSFWFKILFNRKHILLINSIQACCLIGRNFPDFVAVLFSVSVPSLKHLTLFLLRIH